MKRILLAVILALSLCPTLVARNMVVVTYDAKRWGDGVGNQAPRGTKITNVRDIDHVRCIGSIVADSVVYLNRKDLVTIDLYNTIIKKPKGPQLASETRNKAFMADYNKKLKAWEKSCDAQRTKDSLSRDVQKRACVRDNTPHPVAKRLRDVVYNDGAYRTRIDDVSIYTDTVSGKILYNRFDKGEIVPDLSYLSNKWLAINLHNKRTGYILRDDMIKVLCDDYTYMSKVDRDCYAREKARYDAQGKIQLELIAQADAKEAEDTAAKFTMTQGLSAGYHVTWLICAMILALAVMCIVVGATDNPDNYKKRLAILRKLMLILSVVELWYLASLGFEHATWFLRSQAEGSIFVNALVFLAVIAIQAWGLSKYVKGIDTVLYQTTNKKLIIYGIIAALVAVVIDNDDQDLFFTVMAFIAIGQIFYIRDIFKKGRPARKLGLISRGELWKLALGYFIVQLTTIAMAASALVILIIVALVAVFMSRYLRNALLDKSSDTSLYGELENEILNDRNQGKISEDRARQLLEKLRDNKSSGRPFDVGDY